MTREFVILRDACGPKNLSYDFAGAPRSVFERGCFATYIRSGIAVARNPAHIDRLKPNYYDPAAASQARTDMKIFLKVVVAVVALFALTLVILRITGLNPRGPRPGLWLSGNVVAVPVADWSFADRYPTIEVQTKTRYLIPHSVTIWCVSYQKHLYLQAIGKTWSGNLARDPRVRIKIGSQLYDGTAAYVTDHNEYFGVEANMAQKYSRWHWRASKQYYPNTFFRVQQ